MSSSSSSCRVCNGCGPFYASSLAHANYICKKCACKSATARRTADPARVLAYRLYNTCRRHDRQHKHGRHQLAAVVRKALLQWGLQSVISQETDTSKLTLAPYFRDVDRDAAWNYVVVTSREAKSLSHLKNEQQAHAHFPVHVQQYMEVMRAAKLA